jgi:hypothetical protein
VCTAVQSRRRANYLVSSVSSSRMVIAPPSVVVYPPES